MAAYYFSFGETGAELVDRVLSAVATAGRSYHHTESWGDEGLEDWGPFRGGDYVSWIQNAAIDVAAQMRERDAQIAALTAIALDALACWQGEDFRAEVFKEAGKPDPKGRPRHDPDPTDAATVPIQSTGVYPVEPIPGPPGQTGAISPQRTHLPKA